MAEAARPLALVTGGLRRLGRAIVDRFADEGVDIALHYGRSPQAEANQAVQEVRARGVNACAVAFDVADDDATAAGLQRFEAHFGRSPDILVNCASVFEWDDVSTVTRANLRRQFEINLFGPVMLTRMIAERAPDNVRGSIINLLDQKLMNPNPDHLSYSLTKYALAGFTDMMARALAPRFRVNGIAPGYVLPGPGESDERFRSLHDQTPLARGPTADDIADAAVFLVRNRAVTNQTLIIDGGAHIRPAERDFAFL
ncbi:SDR family oxidoreductase [bacterium]|nr:SDR family oxidoreductase [bacterium]